MMKKLLWVATWVAAAGVVRAGPNTIPLYENFGSLTNVPIIDATAFANYGTFSVSSPLPYETFHTLNFTNQGAMSGSPGFWFNYSDDAQVRYPAASFFNGPSGQISARAGFFGAVLGQVPFQSPAAVLRIQATNIVNRGVLQADITGLIDVEGQNVDLARSVLGIGTTPQGGGYQIEDPNWVYTPDYGIEDEYWGFGAQPPPLNSAGLITSYQGSLTANVPMHCVTNTADFESANPYCMGPGYPTGGISPIHAPYSFVHTNELSPTNWGIDVVVVGITDSNITPTVKFYPSSDPSNSLYTATLGLSTYLTNVATSGRDLNQLFLVDRLGGEPQDMQYVTNGLNLTDGTPIRPGTFEFTRQTPLEYALGTPPNAYYPTNLQQVVYAGPGQAVTNISTNVVTDPTVPSTTTNIVTNIVQSMGYAFRAVTNVYAGYGAFVTNYMSSAPALPGGVVTNAQGRIEIVANNLNLDRARIRGEQYVSIRAKHLVSSSQAAIDAGNIGYNLGSTNGTLKLQSLTLPQAQRLAGWLYAWSGVWTNQLNVVTNSITNATTVISNQDGTVTTTNDPGTNVFTTNSIEVKVHVLMVDARLLKTRFPVYIDSLTTHSTNVFMGDTMRVLQSLNMDAQTLTIDSNGQFYLGDIFSPGSQIIDWNASEFPNLQYLTNNGIISVPSVENLGADTAAPYQVIVNRGTNVAQAIQIHTDYLDARGYIGTATLYPMTDGTLAIVQQPGSIQVNANDVKMQDGEMEAYYDLNLQANSLKLDTYTNVSDFGAINLTVPDELTDSGPSADVALTAAEGVNLKVLPQRSSLLGTKITLTTRPNEAVDSTWAAADLGAVARGYTNNAAVGWLTLNPSTGGQIILSGTGTQNAMYVDYLDFSPTAVADGLTNSLVVNPNMTLYFADSSLPVDQVQKAFPGRVVWVQNFAGPNSGVDVAVTVDANAVPPVVETIRVNRNVRFSTTLDSDGDGIANAYDPTPFDGVTITKVAFTKTTPRQVAITWNGAANTVYQIDSATEVDPSNWQPLMTYTNTATVTGPVTVIDPNPLNGQTRYYRVSYTP